MICNVPLTSGKAPTTHVLELFRNLNEFLETYLIAPIINDNKYNNKNIKLIPILSKRFLCVFYQLPLLFILIKKCIKSSPDIIYERFSPGFFVSLFISKFFGIPYIIEINGMLDHEVKMSGESTVSKILTVVSQKLCYVFSSKIVAVTSEIKYEIIKRYKINTKKIAVIENGANINLFTPLIKKDIRRKLGLDGNFIYVGYYGSFTPWHGLRNLVESSSIIIQNNKKIKFILIGDGLLKDEIRQSVLNKNLDEFYIFLNKISYLEISKYINLFDIGIILKEKKASGSPLKLWEYMACGLPVVATKSQDFDALIKCNGGILVDPEKPEDVASALLTLIKNKKLREDMGQRNREYVYKYHSWNMVAKNVDMIFDEIINNIRN